MPGNRVSPGISGGARGSTITYIAELMPSKIKELCEYCDQNDFWLQMAKKMQFTDDDMQNIQSRIRTTGESPTKILLKIWGDQYNHKVIELFGVFFTLRMDHGMRILKDYVPPEYKLMIKPSAEPKNEPKNEPAISSNHPSNMFPVSNTANNIMISNSNNVSDDYNSIKQNNCVKNSIAKFEEIECIMPEIDYDELTKATNNWDQNLVLGKGGFGTVFRGYWKHTDVAIKQIDYRGAGGSEGVKVQLKQSLNELKYLHKYRHDNILPLYGYCIKGEKPCLVYQLMKGGSLDQRLYTNRLKPLTWLQRINICLGTARGIYYLHSLRSDKPLIHGDIKPGNVLLDQCLQPKIGDFGLAMEGPNAINRTVQVPQVFGTRAYLPPEFLNSKRLSTQVDTFSFGVVLLETFTGRRAIDRNRNLLTKTIVNQLEANNNKFTDLVDKRMDLIHQADEMVCIQSIKLGLQCINERPEQRPDMETVLKTINSYYNGNLFMQ